jgi:hypothetical protein
MLRSWKYCEKCEGEGQVELNETVVECDGCSGEGELVITYPEDKIVYVNIYEVTREYGGPEEGGWYYNNFNCVESVPVKNKHSELMQDEMKKEYSSRKHGNIYSVLGGTDIEVYIEEKPKQSETKERPYYE